MCRTPVQFSSVHVTEREQLDKQNINIFTCSESEAAVTISLCPSDAVARVGETVVLRAAQPDSEVMRWYMRQITDDGLAKKTCIYTGMEIDYKQVDYRYARKYLKFSLSSVFLTSSFLPRDANDRP